MNKRLMQATRLLRVTSLKGLERRALTRRYIVALVVVGAILLGLQALWSVQAGKHASDGKLIDDSGLQRMLSQRVALLAKDVVGAISDQVRSRRVAALQTAVNVMSANHAALSEDWRDRAAAGESAFAALLADGGVNVRLKSFLTLAHTFLETDGQTRSGWLQLQDMAASLAQASRDDFLDQLDAVVKLYESENRQNIARLQQAGTLSIVLGLIVLIAVGLLIFQPMVDVIVDAIESLKESRDEQFELGRRMSHDLRSPIASSLGVAAIVQETLEEGDIDEAREAAKRLHGALTRLDRVLARLISVTRLHRVTPIFESVDLEALLREVAHVVEPAAHVSVHSSFDQSVTTDPAILRAILLSLLDNAVTFRQDSSAEIALTLTPLASGIELAVQDNGIGIPEQCRSRVFEMFQQFHPDRSQGTGLGLYLCKVSARILCAELDYEALPDGSRFTLVLPHRRMLAA